MRRYLLPQGAGHLSFFPSLKVDHKLLHRRVLNRERRVEEHSGGFLSKSAGRRAQRLFLEAESCPVSLQRVKGKRKHGALRRASPARTGRGRG